MNRRQVLKTFASSALASCASGATDGGARAPGVVPKRTGLGLVTYCCRFRRDSLRKANPETNLYSPDRFFEHCRSLGAGGMQISLGVLRHDAARALRDRVEQHEMFVEAIVRLPKDKADIARFAREMDTAKGAGAKAARTTIIPGRRYEYFDSLEKFRDFENRGREALQRGAPVAEKLKLPLAVENHKDHRDDERVALFEQISSEFVGACVDTGNSVALLEDAVGTAEALAPWAHSVHLKDQALQEYADGFLLGDIPLGQGGLDLKTIVSVLRKAKPDINFSLELITRDPLKVPCLTEQYWATFPDLPARELAQTMQYVREHSSDKLQYVSKLSLEEQVAVEDANVRASLDYARDVLKL